MRANLSYAVVAAAQTLGAGCERDPLAAPDNDVAGDSTPVTASGQLVLDWNTTVFDVGTRADQYADPFLHLRALTMMHLAMHDAVNGASAKYARYALAAADETADPGVAATAAAHGVLSALYPGQSALLDAKLNETTAGAESAASTERGLALGKAAAQAILQSRAADRSDASEPYAPGTEPGRYRFVPPFDLVYRPGWRNVKPFALAAGDQFRSAPPPPLESAEYFADYEEVKAYGRASESSRTAEQTFYADWWYELSEIGWNRIARVTWPEQNQRDLWFTARLFALLNVGLMDAYIAGWDSKLHYDLWRPYTAIRAGNADENAATVAQANWEPYCVTPPVQDYPSTHAALGAAAAALLYHGYGRDVPFTMESPSAKPSGQKRALARFQEAAAENADSRVACGIHFRFATRAGLELGEQVGEQVLETLLLPAGGAAQLQINRGEFRADGP
jgi:hypothetical protein